MADKSNQTLREDFQRAFKFCRFEESKSFEVARNEAIAATCALHGGSINDHAEDIHVALEDLCRNHRELWEDDIKSDDNRWFQHFYEPKYGNYKYDVDKVWIEEHHKLMSFRFQWFREYDRYRKTLMSGKPAKTPTELRSLDYQEKWDFKKEELFDRYKELHAGAILMHEQINYLERVVRGEGNRYKQLKGKITGAGTIVIVLALLFVVTYYGI